jgi:hypothetical protein
MKGSFVLTVKGYVIVAADTTAVQSIVKMKFDADKVKAQSSSSYGIILVRQISPSFLYSS